LSQFSNPFSFTFLLATFILVFINFVASFMIFLELLTGTTFEFLPRESHEDILDLVVVP